MLIRIAMFIVMASLVCLMSAEATEYAVAISSAPVLNTPNFKDVFGGTSEKALKADRCGQVRELEYIALPGSVFTILNKIYSGPAEVYQVVTEEYVAPPNVRLYVDSRFMELVQVVPAPRIRHLPLRQEIVAALRDSVGSSYVWGGNIPGGVPELEAWFFKDAMEEDKKRLTLSGLDCSGLLYHATGGWTPRNTSQLIAFGQGVEIAGKQSAEIVTMLQPLDLIVWHGHVIIVLDQDTAIESRLVCGKPGNGGVVMTRLSERISGVMRKRRPTNFWPGSNKRQDVFVVRRWHGGS